MVGPAPDPATLRRLTSLSWLLGGVALALSAVVFAAGLLQGRSLGEMVITAISLTVAAVPESLPAVVTVALAMGAHRMARRSAIVRSLPAVETLGSVTVVAADKTGTLTEGRMAAERLVTVAGGYALTGEGYDPAGQVAGPQEGQASGRAAPDDGAALRRLALDILLCNDADIVPPAADRPQWTAIGDPMEAALVVAARRSGLSGAERSAYPRTAEIPFDAERRRMTTVHRMPASTALVICKGAPESVLDSPGLLADDPALVARLRAEADRLARDGYRVIAVADAERDAPPPPGQVERGLRLAGLVALVDPIRRGAHDAIRSFDDAGIRLVLITGDHPATAAAVADRLALAPGTVVHGGQLEERGFEVDGVRVFARIRPEQKLSIVQALQQQGEVVAMTGDGVNDAPALRRADIGVAMGRDGTEAARQAGDLVLADDNLATVTSAVEEGRRIYANVRRFLGYALSGGLAEVLVMLAGPLLGLRVPLLPAQILWVNMLTHGLPGVALGAEPPEQGAMRQPPRPPDEAMLGAGLWRRVAGTGAAIGAVSLGVAVWAQSAGRPWQSMLFTTLGFAQLGVALAVRSRRGGGAPGNPLLSVAVAGSLVLQVAAVQLPLLHTLLGTESLDAMEFVVCGALATLPGLLLLAVRRWAGRGPGRLATARFRPGRSGRRSGPRRSPSPRSPDADPQPTRPMAGRAALTGRKP